MKRKISWMLVLVLLLSASLTAAPRASAANAAAQQFVDCAVTQVGKKRADYGYTVNWCGYFVGWCAQNLGLQSILPSVGSRSANGVTIYQYVIDHGGSGVRFYNDRSDMQKGTYLADRGSYTPQAGDIVIFAWGSKSNGHLIINHVGIVQRVENGRIYVVHGNYHTGSISGGIVCGPGCSVCGGASWSLNSSQIYAYARPNWPGESLPEAAAIEPGLYSLIPQCAPERRLDVADGATNTGANVQIWRSNDTAAQQWNISPTEGGYYKLISQESGKALDVADAKTAEGTNVQQCIWTGNHAQQWRFTDAGDGYYYITTRLDDGMRLDVNEMGDANGVNVQIWSANESTAQKWRLVAVEPGELTHTHQKGVFQFHEALHPHYAYYQCSLCGVNFTDGSTTTLSSCAVCNPSTGTSGGATAERTVTGYFDCHVLIHTTEGQAVNAYANILDTERRNWFDRGQVLLSYTGARVSDGSTWYQVKAYNMYDELVTLWVNAGSPGVTVEEVQEKPNCDNGHTWGAWEVTRSATCEQGGVSRRVCLVCGEAQEQAIDPLGHDYYLARETDTTKTYTCKTCGASYTEAKELPVPTGGMDHFTAVTRYADETFRDVGAGDWFRGNVSMAYEFGLMRGTGEGTFSPNNHVTLAEAVTLAARLHSVYYTGEEDFPVYDGGNWFDPYVNYARDNGLISENYLYTRPATREEFVHILAQALPDKELKPTADTITFADAGEIVYMGDVTLLSGAGVINGVKENGQTYFKPSAPITRAEVAAVVSRMARPEARIGQ